MSPQRCHSLTELCLLLALEILTKWFSSTRLETRTKESNTSASARVFQTHINHNIARNESEGQPGSGRGGKPVPQLLQGGTIDRPDIPS